MKNEVHMLEKKFYDFAELGNYMYELASCESQVVTAVLLYEDAIKLIKWIMLYDDITVGRIGIESEYYCGYDKEFYIIIDTDLVLNVIPAYQLQEDETAEGYLIIKSDVILYGGDVSSKLALHNTYGNKYEIIIETNDNKDKCGDCCEDCSNCPHKETSETIAETLDAIDYILNHFGDN